MKTTLILLLVLLTFSMSFAKKHQHRHHHSRTHHDGQNMDAKFDSAYKSGSHPWDYTPNLFSEKGGTTSVGSSHEVVNFNEIKGAIDGKYYPWAKFRFHQKKNLKKSLLAKREQLEKSFLEPRFKKAPYISIANLNEKVEKAMSNDIYAPNNSASTVELGDEKFDFNQVPRFHRFRFAKNHKKMEEQFLIEKHPQNSKRVHMTPQSGDFSFLQKKATVKKVAVRKVAVKKSGMNMSAAMAAKWAKLHDLEKRTLIGDKNDKNLKKFVFTPYKDFYNMRFMIKKNTKNAAKLQSMEEAFLIEKSPKNAKRVHMVPQVAAAKFGQFRFAEKKVAVSKKAGAKSGMNMSAAMAAKWAKLHDLEKQTLMVDQNEKKHKRFVFTPYKDFYNMRFMIKKNTKNAAKLQSMEEAFLIEKSPKNAKRVHMVPQIEGYRFMQKKAGKHQQFAKEFAESKEWQQKHDLENQFLIKKHPRFMQLHKSPYISPDVIDSEVDEAMRSGVTAQNEQTVRHIDANMDEGKFDFNQLPKLAFRFMKKSKSQQKKNWNELERQFFLPDYYKTEQVFEQ